MFSEGIHRHYIYYAKPIGRKKTTYTHFHEVNSTVGVLDV